MELSASDAFTFSPIFIRLITCALMNIGGRKINCALCKLSF